ncbi:alpha-L-fucosidase [Pelagicoccus sp. SDUM812005]|uniref:alpha-L-fucosidase n=1 Tax=Pelagicoccus sp. SDUM812005 TaxID=3041257 RepID=UPI00280ECC40|nr:alpha-L-fucosidase [Pelagicoccus sp. SDUM812005]MDQ8183555.1 alpha-L-fucosidase [Pelagicoccus sp. SDUM812005]
MKKENALKSNPSRRDVLKSGLALAGASALAPFSFMGCGGGKKAARVPSYLSGYEDLYVTDPRQAALKCFADSKFGLFLHYGLYSLKEGFHQGQHSRPAEWVMLRGKIPVAEYAELADAFAAEKFDADYITDMALGAGMKYVNITTRHHDSFCLFESKYTDFHSVNSAAKRDLVGELSEQCQKKGLGLHLYYSHGRDWRHPHAPNNEEWTAASSARPDYEEREPFYKYGEEHDLQLYVEFMKNQVTELLTNYGPIASIWLDGIRTPKTLPERLHEFRTQELYDHIHSLQPQVLVAYKQGLLGTEDFIAPERHWKGESSVPLEICDTLQPYSWGYDRSAHEGHKTPDQVMALLDAAWARGGNLLLNTGPLPDGSIHPDDARTLSEVGKRLGLASAG